MANTVQLPKGAIILWEGRNPVNGTLDGSIPKNWEEVESMRGRVPVGWDKENNLDLNIFYGKFIVLGDVGGTAKYALSKDEMPAHNHSIFPFNKFVAKASDLNNNNSAKSFDTGGGSSELAIGNLNATQMSDATEKAVGINKPHENTQPYKVLIYIRSKKGV